MDTVLGCEGSKKLLLTLHFGETNFMMAYLLDSKEARGIEAVFDSINSALGTPLSYKSMPIILTDRGGEFRHPVFQHHFICQNVSYKSLLYPIHVPYKRCSNDITTKVCFKTPQISVLNYHKSLHQNSANVSFVIDNAKDFGYNNIKGW